MTKIFFRERATELLITIITFCIGFFFFTIVHDDYGSFLLNMAAGQFSDFPFIDLHYLGLVRVNTIYKFLNTTAPAYNWMAVAFLLFNFLSLYLLLRAVKNITLKNNSDLYLTIFIQSVLALFFVENIITLSHTRFSLLFCGVSLFNLAFTKKINATNLLLNTIVFVLGMLHRPESSLGMFALVSVGYLFFRFDFIRLLKRFWLPAFATTIWFMSFAIGWKHTDKFIIKVEPEIEYKLMDKRVVNISEMKSAADSIKYQAALIGMWFDPTVVTADFLRSILLPGANLSIEHALKVFFHILSFYKHYIFISSIVLSCFFLSFFLPDRKKLIFKLLLLQVTTFLLLYALDYTGLLVAKRHFLNLHLVALLISLFYFFEGGVSLFQEKRYLLTICLFAVLAGTIQTLVNYKQENDAITRDYICYESAIRELENSYSDRIVVVTLNTYHLFDHIFSIKTNNYKKNTYLLYDTFTFSLFPEYQNYLRKISGCNPVNPVEFFKWLADNNALYVSIPERYLIAEKYMRLVHRQNLKFVEDGNFHLSSCMNSVYNKKTQILNVTIESQTSAGIFRKPMYID